MCDEFFFCFSNFIVSKKCLIIKSYSLSIILKLRSNSTESNSVKYFVIREHFIILSQNFESLCQILSNISLRLSEKIKVIWIERRVFIRNDIRFYLMIRKQKIWKILQWFFMCNSLYKNIHINTKLMNEWKKEHISIDFEKNIIHVSKTNHHECEEYVLNIEINNLKNELQTSMLNQDDFYNINSVLFDVNENKQDSTISIFDDLNNLILNFIQNENNIVKKTTSEFQSTLINDKTEYVLFYFFWKNDFQKQLKWFALFYNNFFVFIFKRRREISWAKNSTNIITNVREISLESSQSSVCIQIL